MTKIYIFKMGSSTLMLLDVVDSFANAELESNPHYIEIVNGKSSETCAQTAVM